MSNILNWAKANILIVVSVLVVLLAIGSFFWPTGAEVQTLREDIRRVKSMSDSVNRYMSPTVQIPSPTPGGQPESVSIPYSAANVAMLGQLFREMASGYTNLFQYVVDFNHYGPNDANPHEVMLQGLFPEPQSDSIRLDADEAFIRKVDEFYRQLRAGQPPSEQEIATHLAQVEEQFAASAPMTVRSLQAEHQEKLAQQKLEAQREMIKNRAQQIRVYAASPRTGAMMATSRSGRSGRSNDRGAMLGVFDVGQWISGGGQPTNATLWEAQMKLWMQQDIVAAINLANQNSSSVINAPVKRIDQIRVRPGYIGVAEERQQQQSSDSSETTGPAQQNIDQPLEPNFAASPTGRVSNPLYDVRQAEVIVVVASEDLPRLLNAFGKVNLMTPIITRIASLDEYGEFAAGYYFGDEDVVEVELLIESLWMRRWTAGQTDKQAIAEYLAENPNDSNFASMSEEAKLNYLKENGLYDIGLMPDAVRFRLGLPTRDPDYKPEGWQEQQEGMYPGMEFGMPGMMPPMQ